MEQQTKILDIGNGRTIKIPVNYQHFILDYSNSPEGHGWNGKMWSISWNV